MKQSSLVLLNFYKMHQEFKCNVENQDGKTHKQKFTGEVTRNYCSIYNYDSVNFKTAASWMNFTPQYFSKIF